ncbi:MAG: ribonuclease III [Acidaminococcaceae bacterium]|nr:ribonuclease III [Acidaminococcaceae bacterium]
MKFIRFQQLKEQALAVCQEEGRQLPEPDQMNPIVLALIGDSVFTFYVRMRLLPVSSHVQVIHSIAAKMVSAVMQAKAMHALEKDLSDEESAIVRRGRNAKSMVPKSASVSEYRAATAFEALCGWLLLTDRERRLEEIVEQSFQVISRAMQNDTKG